MLRFKRKKIIFGSKIMNSPDDDPSLLDSSNEFSNPWTWMVGIVERVDSHGREENRLQL
jgi:hypothetical protein